MFFQSTYPDEGIFGIQLYIRGRPWIVTIDDYLPLYNGALIFEKQGTNKNFWAALLEKTFAKITGNYEAINYGWQMEAQRFITGAPTYYTYTSAEDGPTSFANIKAALAQNFVVGCDTGSYSYFGLVTSHAYAVMGAYTITDDSGNSHNLLRIRNPWGTDNWSGPWSDSSANWTSKTMG
jgi:hypothetical protein